MRHGPRRRLARGQWVPAAGRRALPIGTDVADEAAVEAAADQVEAELGPISLWVNVAFAGYLEFLWDTTMAEFRRVTDATYYGQVHGTRAALAMFTSRRICISA